MNEQILSAKNQAFDFIILFILLFPLLNKLLEELRRTYLQYKSHRFPQSCTIINEIGKPLQKLRKLYLNAIGFYLFCIDATSHSHLHT